MNLNLDFEVIAWAANSTYFILKIYDREINADCCLTYYTIFSDGYVFYTTSKGTNSILWNHLINKQFIEIVDINYELLEVTYTCKLTKKTLIHIL